MANDGAPAGGAAPAAAPTQLPPSSFDSAMSQMNRAPMVVHNEPAGAGSSLKISTRAQTPPLAHAEPLPDANDPDPNDPAELAARAALLGEDQLAVDDSVQGQVLDGDQQAAYEEWKRDRADIRLADSFMDKVISVPWGDKGAMRDVPIAEMKAGYMRTLDHTRKNQAAAAATREAQQTNANVNRFLTDLQQPNTMRERLEDLGYGQVLHAVAEQIYQEKLAEERIFYDLKKKGASDQHIAFMRERFANERKQALQLRAMTRQQAQLQAQAQQLQNTRAQEEQGAQLSNQLAQLRPLAFKKLGLPEDAMHNNAFSKQFIAILESGGGQGRPLREIVLEAAQSAKELVEEYKATAQEEAEQERLRAMGGVQPLAPRRLAGPPPNQATGVTRASGQRKGLADFDAEMARQNGLAR